MNNGEQEPQRIIRADVETSISRRCTTPCGTLYVTCSHRENKPMEVFVATRSLDYDKQIACGWGLNVTAIGCSRLLQIGEERKEVAKLANGARCQRWSPGGITTCPEHMAQTILDMGKYKPGEVVRESAPKKVEGPPTPIAKVCPDCGANLVMESGCDVCHHCGYSKCG